MCLARAQASMHKPVLQSFSSEIEFYVLIEMCFDQAAVQNVSE